MHEYVTLMRPVRREVDGCCVFISVTDSLCSSRLHVIEFAAQISSLVLYSSAPRAICHSGLLRFRCVHVHVPHASSASSQLIKDTVALFPQTHLLYVTLPQIALLDALHT